MNAVDGVSHSVNQLSLNDFGSTNSPQPMEEQEKKKEEKENNDEEYEEYYDDEYVDEEQLKNFVCKTPYCGICGAKDDHWHYACPWFEEIPDGKLPVNDTAFEVVCGCYSPLDDNGICTDFSECLSQKHKRVAYRHTSDLDFSDPSDDDQS